MENNEDHAYEKIVEVGNDFSFFSEMKSFLVSSKSRNYIYRFYFKARSYDAEVTRLCQTHDNLKRKH